MADLDRSEIVALLDRLGAEDDAAVLQAARALDRIVRESGATWDRLVRGFPGADDEEDNAFDDTAIAETAGHGQLSAEDAAEAARLIERLLARAALSETLREDLGDLKRGLADGSFEAMDLRYVRALAKRLGM